MTFEPTPMLSSTNIRTLTVNRESGEVRLLLRDGRAISGVIDVSDLRGATNLSAWVFDWDTRLLESTTTRGQVVTSEVYNPANATSLSGRRTVYLDQNHWSTMGVALTDPDRLTNKSEMMAALQLAELARQGRIVIPLSAAHFRETGALFGDRRYEVGIAMADLSRGWGFRHPAHVWKDELVRTLASELKIPQPAFRPVVTLEPHAALDDGFDASAMPVGGSDLFRLAIGWPGLVIDILIDSEPIPSASIAEWVERQITLSTTLATSKMSRSEQRLAAKLMLWSDNAQAVHDALGQLGQDISALGKFTARDVPGLLDSKPMLKYFSEVMTQRLLNSSTRWRENDLTDLMFLAAGAGYADYVVAEKHTGTQLRQVQRSQNYPVTVFTKIGDLVDQIS